MADAPLTPMMQQYWDAKNGYPGAMVFFRNGDFYELFEDDAVVGSRILGIRLTRRDEKIPMAGVPIEKLDHYLAILLRSGHRVAVCEQMEEPGPGKKLIRREVNRVVSAGTVTEDELLEPHKSNFLLALCRSKNETFGLAWAEPSTGAFYACDVDADQVADTLARIAPAECLLPDREADVLRTRFAGAVPKTVTPRPDWTFDTVSARQALFQQFQVSTFTGFGFEDAQPCVTAAGAVVLYLQETLKAGLVHLRRVTPYKAGEHLLLDEVTRRSLELTRTLRDNSREGSLLAVLDHTVTPMGARFLHDALLTPLNKHDAITARLDAVDELLKDHALREDVRELLQRTADLHRLTTRVSTGRATPRDLGSIARTLRLLPKIKAKLAGRRAGLIAELDRTLELCPDLRQMLDAALNDELPMSAKDGGLLRDGYLPELDQLRSLAKDGKDWILRYQAAEITRTGINSLKVGYNQIDGYYIEITNANETRVPESYKHQKTLKGAKRYFTPDLREHEEKVLSADDKAKALEFEQFLSIRTQIAAQTHRLLSTADSLALLDFLQSLAEHAATRGYVRPQLVAEPVLNIRQGRHPVLDVLLPAGTFVPNDVRLAPGEGRFWLITGPNMAGKSTFIRQVALLTLLAHVGSFVPATTATIGLTDRIFTRVGASDELGRGQSTFMVEMTEAANILNNATPRSLVILDEIGRGTSTYDGVSLAWAMTEHLHSVIGCRALFASHYHELAGLSETLDDLRNYTVQVKESGHEVIFLHTIAAGTADRSYGIHVARLAGVPDTVLSRAADVLATLESKPRPTPMSQMVRPPEAPKRRPKPAGPTLFGDG